MHCNQHLHLEYVRISWEARSHQEATPAASKPKLQPGSLTALNHSCLASLASPLENPVFRSSWVHLTRDCAFRGPQLPRAQELGCYWSEGGSAVPWEVSCLLWNSGSTGVFWVGYWMLQVGFGYFQRCPSQQPPAASSLNPYKWCFLTEKEHLDKWVLLEDTFALSKFLIHTSQQGIWLGTCRSFEHIPEKKSIFSSFSSC